MRLCTIIKLCGLLFMLGGKLKAETIITTDYLVWTLSNLNGSITVPATVPGGVYTDLMNGSVLTNGDFYYRYNDFEYRWVSYDHWRYSTTIDLPESLMDNERIIFEFNGLDTVADIFLDGSRIHACLNMFARCAVDVKPYLNPPSISNLTILFRSPVQYSEREYNDYYDEFGYYVLPTCVDPAYQGECHANHIRKMQASFSWDWGPAFPNMGIWQPWRIIGWSGLKINNVYFQSDPISPLPDKYDPDLKAAWTVYFKIYYDLAVSSGNIEGTLNVTLDGVEYYNKDIVIDASTLQNQKGVYEDYFVVPEDTVETWWPNGYGNQPLYPFTASFKPTNIADSESSKTVLIGFRTVELDQSFVNETDPSLGRYYRAKVNNIYIFLLGSNWIPAHVLPEQVTPNYTRQLLTDARDTHQNCLRIWGGGIYETEEFYQIADELGILIWHDLMFACSMYPTDSGFLNTTFDEVYYQFQRLQHHPSILLWATNNENEAALKDNWYGTADNYEQYKEDYVKLYVDTITTNLREVEKSRPVVVSSPSNGLASEEVGYIADNPYDSRYGDVHFYDYVSNGWNYETFPATRFSSEYGYQSFPSYQTLLPVFAEEDMSIDSPMLEHRQHHPNGQEELRIQLQMHFDYDPETTDFHTYLYLLQLHQALAVKTETEYYRRIRNTLNEDGSGLTMGALYWQLNDVWQGASWASIEYGGRWKILHNYVRKFFNPLTIIPWIQDGKLKVSLVNDMPIDVLVAEQEELRIEISFVLFDQSYFNGATYDVDKDIMSQSAIEALDLDLELDLDATNICSGGGTSTEEPFNNCFIVVSLVNSNTVLANNFLLLGEPKDSFLPEVNIDTSVSEVGENELNITLSADRMAMFVFLESPINGVFSDNGFIIPWDQQVNIMFTGRDPVDVIPFINTLNVTYLSNSYDMSREEMY